MKLNKSRFVFSCQFIGTRFSGTQKQKNANTVQSELEEVFSIFFKEKISIIFSSRLDAGVHAKALIGHFDLSENQKLKKLSENQICRHLNGILSRDIAIIKFKEIDINFHSRKDAISRTYNYRLRINDLRMPLEDHYVSTLKLDNLDLDFLNEQSKILIGNHDCSGLARNFEYKTYTVCMINKCFWEKQQGLFIFHITANHFLYKMVRNIVGTQIDMYSGKIPKDSLYKALIEKNNNYLGQTAVAKGLCLEAVNYEKDF